MTSAIDDRHLLCMAVNDRTASSRQFTVRWYTNGNRYRYSNVESVNSLMSAAPWIACKDVFIQDNPHKKPSMAAPAMCS
ncbi:hypothetical protein TNCV_4369161 [Trichonephila clavipes]|nr:hypothetical protein TNCV_4369161 [Trichonephila clavipes]